MENLLKVETLKVTDVAKILHKNAEWVRAGLRQGSLPFGNAVQSASGRWNYIIIESKKRLLIICLSIVVLYLYVFLYQQLY